MEIILNSLYKSLYPDRILKQEQIEIITNLINGRDCLALLPTGFGKSICYQLPLLYFKKNVIVVSPLLALMENQMILLKKIGIDSICINSTMPLIDKSHNKIELLNLDIYKIIYITPESLLKEELFIKDLIHHKKLCLIAIDEAHCISSWGHDFRKDYQQLGCLKDWIGDNKIGFYACTATATINVQTEIINNLKLNNPKIIKSSFDRKNLYLSFFKKTNIKSDIYPYLLKHKDNFTIIYVKTRDETEKICNIIKELNLSSHAYHAGLSDTLRKEIHTNFINGIYKIIIATCAFGMGIDHDISLIIHYGACNSIETYVQEIGRAGRNGKDAECILFWNDNDINICRFLLKDNTNRELKKIKEEQLELMYKFIYTNTCRKQLILKHFDEILENKCNMCDNCKNNDNNNIFNQKILYWPIFLIIKTVIICSSEYCQRGIGIKKLIDIIRGAKNKNVLEYKNLTVYGKCNNINQIIFKDIIKMLIYNNFLKEKSIDNTYCTIIVTTEKSNKFWQDAKIYNSINEMNNINWYIFDIPKSFNNIIDFIIKFENQ